MIFLLFISDKIQDFLFGARDYKKGLNESITILSWSDRRSFNLKQSAFKSVIN